jgi:hypothetical protein
MLKMKNFKTESKAVNLELIARIEKEQENKIENYEEDNFTVFYLASFVIVAIFAFAFISL